jgi:RNA polymerase sigma factor (sigma-70 family)
MRDDPVVTDLVIRAGGGDQQAWDELVDRYAPLIWGICRRYQLPDAHAADVGQAVWLHLAGHLDSFRDRAALAGWLATTTRRECGRVLRATRGLRADGRELQDAPDEQTTTAEHELLAAERDAGLRRAFARLPPAASDCWPCSSPTLQCPMPRSASSWAYRSRASGPTAAATWTGCAATRPSPA